MGKIVTYEPDELKSLIKSALNEFENEKSEQGQIALYTVNQVAKKIHRAHATIKKLIKQGYLKTTKDGLIPEASINEYLQKV